MDLRLKFIGVNESDVIATSSLCKYTGTGISAEFVSVEPQSPSYYIFKDASDVTNKIADVKMGAYNLDTSIIDVNGNNKGNITPTVRQHYHYDSSNNALYECNDESHYGTFPR